MERIIHSLLASSLMWNKERLCLWNIYALKSKCNKCHAYTSLIGSSWWISISYYRRDSAINCCKGRYWGSWKLLQSKGSWVFWLGLLISRIRLIQISLKFTGINAIIDLIITFPWSHDGYARKWSLNCRKIVLSWVLNWINILDNMRQEVNTI